MPELDELDLEKEFSSELEGEEPEEEEQAEEEEGQEKEEGKDDFSDIRKDLQDIKARLAKEPEAKQQSKSSTDELIEKLRPAYEKRTKRLQSEGYAEEEARRIAWEDTWEEYQEREQLKREILAEMGLILDTTVGEDAMKRIVASDLSKAGVVGVTPDEVASHLQKKGLTLSMLRSYPEETRATLVEEIGWAVAGRKLAKGQGKGLPRQSAPGGGPPSSGGYQNVSHSDDVIEMQARFLAQLNPDIPFERHLETAKRAAARRR